MEQSPWNSLRVQLQGLLKSTHTLVGLLGVMTLLGIWFCLKSGFWFGAYLFCIVLAVVSLIVVGRYALKGPEADRGQPTVSFSHQDNRMQAQFVNIDLTGDVARLLHAIINRRPLPPPSGVLEGLASDPNATIRQVDPEAAQLLAREDSRLDASTIPPMLMTEGGAEQQ
jgi:hypothetical protein